MKNCQLRMVLVLLMSVLVGIGLVMILSASAVQGQENHGDPYFFLKRQVLWLGIGLVLFWGASRLNYHWLQAKSRWCALVAVLLLLAVLIPGLGKESGGAQRWLKVGKIGFQPSELVKYLLLIYLADLFSRHQDKINHFGVGFLPPIAITALLAGLVLIQPDLGTAMSLGAAGVVMMFAAGTRLAHLLLMGLAFLPALYLLIFRVGYRRQRILAFLHPWDDPQGAGFQIIQSLVALGSGGVSGLGLGESRQKLFYLPASATDFIYSILGEEMGFIGTAAVVFLFAGLLVAGFSVARSAPDLYGRLLAVGITTMLILQAFVNIGVASGVLPTKGLPLPFISYGGSNLVSSCLAMGILINIAARPGKGAAPVQKAGIAAGLFNQRIYRRRVKA